MQRTLSQDDEWHVVLVLYTGCRLQITTGHITNLYARKTVFRAAYSQWRVYKKLVVQEALVLCPMPLHIMPPKSPQLISCNTGHYAA